MTEAASDKTSTSLPPQLDGKLEQVLDSFAARLLGGERPSVSEVLKNAPELATRIRELFPAAELLGNGPASTSDGGQLPAAGILHGGADRLGSHRLVREIGRGGMGVVYEALDESLGRKVALKVLPFHSHTSPGCLERFQREARAAAGLQHRGIVPILGIGEDRGVHFYAMQHIEGESLERVAEEVRRLRNPAAGELHAPGRSSRGQTLAAAVLTDGFRPASRSRPDARELTAAPKGSSPVRERTGGAPALAAETVTEQATPLPHRDLASGPAEERTAGDPTPYFRSVGRLVRDAAEAVGYANARGILHRDIKPSNLLLDMSGHLWIVDFGLAVSEGEDRLTHSGDIIGTLRYMAPERFDGKCDARSEVYSLGTTLFELLTQRPAFEQSDRAGLYKAVTEGLLQAPRKIDPRIPEALERIVLRAVDRRPERRYASALALAADLDAFLEGREVSAIPRPARRSLPLRRKAVLAVSILCLIAAAAGAWHLAGVHRPRSPQHFVVADFNADGNIDILTGNADSSSVTFLSNDGHGVFRVDRHLQVESRPFAVAVVDFDGNQAPDLLACNYNTRSIWGLKNDGRGQFALLGAIPLDASPNFAEVLGRPQPHTLRVAVATEAKSLLVLDVEADGQWSRVSTVELAAPAKTLEAADFDADGHMDLALGHGLQGGLTVLEGSRDGELAAGKRHGVPGSNAAGGEAVIPSSWGLQAADWNGDGRSDLAVAPIFMSNVLFVLLSERAGSLGSPRAVSLPGAAQSLAAADFDGDARMDLAGAGDNAAYVCLLRGRGDGTFDPPRQLPSLGQGAAWIEAADLDRDGDPDLVVVHLSSSDLAVYLNDGEGRFENCSKVAITSWRQWLRDPAR